MTTEPQVRPADAREVATMQAVVQDEYGEPADVLRLEQIDRPAIGDDEVLVRVTAAGVDRGVWHMVAGLPLPIRLAGFGVRRPMNRVPGTDLAGRVVAVGRAVTKFHVGDEVFGAGMGTFAEYARARADRLARRPEGLTAEQAATVAVSAVTALKAVRDHGRVQSGQRVLVIGASGGVGSYAVQIAKALGADVTGVCRTSKVDLVRSLGADVVIDYQRTDDLGAGRYDAILDIGGSRRLSVLRRALAPRGTLVIVGGETGGRVLGGVQRQLRAALMNPFVRQQLGTFVARVDAAGLAAVSDLIVAGAVMPAIDRTFPLADAAAAIAYLQEGSVRGKVALTV